jgi:hypothetical protein
VLNFFLGEMLQSPILQVTVLFHRLPLLKAIQSTPWFCRQVMAYEDGLFSDLFMIAQD